MLNLMLVASYDSVSLFPWAGTSPLHSQALFSTHKSTTPEFETSVFKARRLCFFMFCFSTDVMGGGAWFFGSWGKISSWCWYRHAVGEAPRLVLALRLLSGRKSCCTTDLVRIRLIRPLKCLDVHLPKHEWFLNGWYGSDCHASASGLHLHFWLW